MSGQLYALNEGAHLSRVRRDQQPQSATITFGEASEIYEKQGGDRRFLGALRQYFGPLPLSEITQERIDQVAKIALAGAKESTRIRQYYVPLAAILHHAAELQLCPYLVIRRPRAATIDRVRWISPAHSMRLAAMCSMHFRPLYLFLQHTGARPAEALFVNWSQINFRRREVFFAASKGAEERVLPLASVVISALEALPHRSGSVFRRPDGEPYKRSRRAASAMKTAFSTACRRAAIEDFTLRDVRVTWCIWQLAVCRDLDVLVSRGGWADRRMLARFKTVPSSDLDSLRAALREQCWDAHLAILQGDHDE